MSSLSDSLIEGTGGYPIPRELMCDDPVGPRSCIEKVYQNGASGGGSTLAYSFIGKPVDKLELMQIRLKNKLSDNWGAVIVPREILPVVYEYSLGIVGTSRENYTIIGLLPTDKLDGEARWRIGISSNQQMIFSPIELFTDLQLGPPVYNRAVTLDDTI